MNYVDGIEINCHPLYGNTYSNEIIKIAKQNNLIITCGGDYHHDTYRPKCGVYFPDDIKSNKDLKDYLVNSNEIKLCIQEVNYYEDDYLFIKR
jgi:hypothetical protein